MASIPMRFLPAYYAARAQGYAPQVTNSQQVRVGQNRDFLDPYAQAAQRAPTLGQDAITAYAGGYDPVAQRVAAYGRQAGKYGPDVDNSQQLNLARQSGSRMREVTFNPGRRAGVGAIVPSPASFRLNGLGAAEGEKAWYENPLYLGLGAAAVVGAVWFFAR